MKCNYVYVVVDISTYTNKDILSIDSNIDSFFSNLTGHQEIRAYVFYVLKETFVRHSSFIVGLWIQFI